MKIEDVLKGTKGFKGYSVWKATVKVNFNGTPMLTPVTIFAANQNMAKALLQTQYGKNAVISQVQKVK